MAQDEHRMVFDIRGKRRHVVKAVYAVLAVLMAASLFLVVGPVNIGSLFGGESASSSSLAGEYEDKAARIEAELKKQPGDEGLLLNLTRNRLQAGQQHLSTEDEGEIDDAVQQYRLASNTWSEYLKAAKEPNPATAQQMAGTLFTLAQASRNYPEAQSNIEAAAAAETVYAEARPNLNSLSTQALYLLYSGDFKGAEKANEAAKGKAGNKFQREQLDNKFDSTKKTAEKFQAERKLSEREEAKAAKGNGSESGSLEGNPLGPLGGTGLTE